MVCSVHVLIRFDSVLTLFFVCIFVEATQTFQYSISIHLIRSPHEAPHALCQVCKREGHPWGEVGFTGPETCH